MKKGSGSKEPLRTATPGTHNFGIVHTDDLCVAGAGEGKESGVDLAFAARS